MLTALTRVVTSWATVMAADRGGEFSSSELEDDAEGGTGECGAGESGEADDAAAGGRLPTSSCGRATNVSLSRVGTVEI